MSSSLIRRSAQIVLCVFLGMLLGIASNGPFPAPAEDAAIVQAAPVGTEGSDPTAEKVVCLTFDDGPSETTLSVLEVLEEEQVPATFFVVAADYNAEYLPLLTRAEQSGHQIALHSASHKYSEIYRSSGTYWKDIFLLRQRLADYVDVDSIRCIRFPGGSTNTISRKYGGPGIMEQLKSEVGSRGYYWVDWNVCAEDSAGRPLSAYEVYHNVVSSTNGQTRCVVLMHDSSATATTAQALPDIIHWYKEQGYAFCTVEELYSK